MGGAVCVEDQGPISHILTWPSAGKGLNTESRFTGKLGYVFLLGSQGRLWLFSKASIWGPRSPSEAGKVACRAGSFEPGQRQSEGDYFESLGTCVQILAAPI